MTIQGFTSQLKPLFVFPLRDKQSRRQFLIGSGILFLGYFVPILPGIVVFGYALQVLKSTANGESASMPAWNDWPALFLNGLKGTLVNLIFFLPGFMAFLVGFAAYFSSFIFLTASSGARYDPNGQAILGIFISMAILFLSMALGMLLFLLGTIPFPVSLAHFVVNDRLGAAFKVREWWPILKANRLGYLISFVILFGIFGILNFSFLILYYTFILLCLAYLILIPVSFYVILLGAALFGDSYREGLDILKAKSGEIDLQTA